MKSEVGRIDPSGKLISAAMKACGGLGPVIGLSPASGLVLITSLSGCLYPLHPHASLLSISHGFCVET